MGKGDTFQSTEVLKIFLESHVISQGTQEHTYSRLGLGMRLLTELNFNRQAVWGVGLGGDQALFRARI